MSTNYIDIEAVPEGFENKVRQDLKFKTGKFLWIVKFNIPLDPASVNNLNLYVTSINLTPLKTKITYDVNENSIQIEPLEAYAKDESYILHITTNVKSKGGKNLKKPVRLQFRT